MDSETETVKTARWCSSTHTLPRRMDGKTLHTQYNSMLALPRPSLSLTRSSRSTTALDWTPTSPSSEDFFDLLHKVQGSRLDDQRCSMPSVMKTLTQTPSQHRLQSIMRGSPPYPMIFLPPGGRERPKPKLPARNQEPTKKKVTG